MNHLESMSTDQKESSENNEIIHYEEGTHSIDPSVQEGLKGSEDTVKHSVHRQHYDKFLVDLQKQPDNESKLQFAIDFMEHSIAQSGSPHFKSFWEARSLCLSLFKESISPVLRGILWNKYNELSKEARRLKEILDEQSAFAVEQIEMAIGALETDITNTGDHLKKLVPIDFNIADRVLTSRVQHYQQLQGELSLLNTHASRINALRKELIRTEMRVKQKNKFFQRLSTAGDKVFPHRKDLIKQVSDSFISDVDSFINTHFNDNKGNENLFALREEIKSLQSMAKSLTLNTQSFTHTRMRLSECWDKIKNEEKDRKKERAQQKTVSKQNFDQAMIELTNFNQEVAQLSTHEATKRLDEMGSRFRNLELARDERQLLRDEFNKARKPIQEKIQGEENARLHQEQEKENLRRQKIQDLRNQIEALLKGSEKFDADALSNQRDEILEKINSTLMGKAEKLELERQLKPLRDIIIDKKESSLLNLSDDDRQSLQQLRELLKQRKERRQSIKEQLDSLRKNSGNSGLDFEQAMATNAQVEAEKERLEKINQGIKEVESKIAQLEKR